jgi:hypothetical protein
MNRVYQGKTVWIVSGIGSKTVIKSVFVAKSYQKFVENIVLVNGEEPILVKPEDLKFENNSGFSKILEMCRGLNVSSYTFSQGFKKIEEIHNFFEDRHGEIYDLENQSFGKIFLSKKKANRFFKIRQKWNFVFDEFGMLNL